VKSGRSRGLAYRAKASEVYSRRTGHGGGHWPPPADYRAGGNMVVDIGGGTTGYCRYLAVGASSFMARCAMAGNQMDEAITN